MFKMAKKPILKAYCNKIFFEFLTHEKPAEAIIFLTGFPSSNNGDDIMRFLYDKGFNVFYLRYSGSFQSKGNFLDANPVDDMIECIEYIQKGKAISLWDMEEKKFENKKLILLSGSFGGAIACGIAAKTNDLISKMILSAPVWDFEKHNQFNDEQDFNLLLPFIKRAYTNLYRIKFNDLRKRLARFKELSSDYYIDRLKAPMLILHDSGDNVVSIKHTISMMEKIKNIKLIKHNFGHGTSVDLIKKYWLKINKFITN